MFSIRALVVNLFGHRHTPELDLSPVRDAGNTDGAAIADAYIDAVDAGMAARFAERRPVLLGLPAPAKRVNGRR